MHDATGAWLGWGLGDNDPEVQKLKAYMRRMFRSYAGNLADTPIYDGQMVLAVEEMQRRYGLPVTGIINYATKLKMGYVKPAPVIKPLFFTVEGHSSDMFFGPVADTATALEREGLCHHFPTFYNNGAIPFNNQSGVAELARRLSQTTQDNGVPFPAGTPWLLGTFSQGGIVGYDFYEQFLAPGKPLAWREVDRLGTLAYGDPCRATDSIAPWAAGGISKSGTHGLDPYKRYDLPGCSPKPPNFMDVYREGDIFAENGDDKASQIKAAVYQAIARGDIFSNPFSLAAEIMGMFGLAGGAGGVVQGLEGFAGLANGLFPGIPGMPVLPSLPGLPGFPTFPSGPVNSIGIMAEIVGIIQAIISGISFLADNPNPHYSPYDISGGIAWARGRLFLSRP